jgi:prepilin-type N-terminal cleavage/methylation domain-containing protein
MNGLRQPIRKIEDQNGFTLIEIIIVVTIIGILSYVAVVNFSANNSKLQYETMIRKIATDTRFAQQLALSQGMGTRVYIDQTNNRYYLKWADGSFIQNPVAGGDFIIQFGQGEFRDVSITGTAFSGGRLDFNTSGLPLNAGVAFSGTLNLVTLNNSKRIVVTANTGLLTVENL